MQRGGITPEYKEVVATMRQNSGFSEYEAEDALDLMVESIAERLNDTEREDLAKNLPPELQDIVLGAHIADHDERDLDLVYEFMQKGNLAREHARTQVLAAWETLRSLITERQVSSIKAQMPRQVAAML